MSVPAVAQIAAIRQQLTESWAQKAQLIDKIQSLTLVLQAVELGQQSAREAAEQQPAELDGWDANGAPASER